VEAEVLRVEFVCGIGGDPLVVLEEVQQVGVLGEVVLEGVELGGAGGLGNIL
jgi:hypothetical protein